MKKQIFALLMLVSISCIPTQTSCSNLIANGIYGLGGALLSHLALRAAVKSLHLRLIKTDTKSEEQTTTYRVEPGNDIDLGGATAACLCAYLSYKCFESMLEA